MRKILFVFAAAAVMLGLGFSDADSTIEKNRNNCEDEVIIVVDSEAHWQRYSWTGGPHEGDDPPDFPSDDWQPNVEGDPHNIGVAGPYFVSHGSSGLGDWFYLEWVPEVTHEEPNPNYPCTTTTIPDTTVPDTTVPPTTVPDTTVPPTTVPDTTVPPTTVPDTTVPTTTVPDTTVPTTTVPDTTVPPTTEVRPTTEVPPTTEIPPIDTVPTCEDDPSQDGCEDVLASTGSDSKKNAGLAGLLVLAGSGAMVVSHNLKKKEA